MKQLKHYYGKEEGETHGDLSFCLERIGMVPISMQAEIAERYSYIYLKLKTEGERGFRRRANLWLLRTSEKNKCKNTGGYF
ncbi:MAG: hypothetical protein GY739_01800 [Mesoflavibacter sp.]|nr:hypothetical protein [Mesoflavibacter sp.]MCP4061605.1 hypothetical protein [Pseudoalteromonas sp.]